MINYQNRLFLQLNLLIASMCASVCVCVCCQQTVILSSFFSGHFNALLSKNVQFTHWKHSVSLNLEQLSSRHWLFQIVLVRTYHFSFMSCVFFLDFYFRQLLLSIWIVFFQINVASWTAWKYNKMIVII